MYKIIYRVYVITGNVFVSLLVEKHAEMSISMKFKSFTDT